MAIINSGQKFKPSSSKLTEYRVRLVLNYIIHCYLKMLSDGKQYDYSTRGTVQHEDFLRNGLVNDYLSDRLNKEFYKNSISDNPNVDISFHAEEANTYKNSSGTLKDDYIDISIYENKLDAIWGKQTNDQIKFAIECKRIKVTNDYLQYVGDIQKFADRDFTTFRLPFEGQIAFLEKATFTHSVVSDEVNQRLKIISSIDTATHLNPIQIHSNFEGSYSSIHKRNYGVKNNFHISHLLFDYSTIVLN